MGEFCCAELKKATTHDSDHILSDDYVMTPFGLHYVQEIEFGFWIHEIDKCPFCGMQLDNAE